MSEAMVTLSHVRAASLSGQGVLCATGIRAWCRRYDIDLRELCARGLPLAQFADIDNAFAQRVVQEASRGR